ncbi:1-phosphofructokinase [Corticicoccus populi]|uniref:Tagatose-6-phosphate kinase n=1 Tax=Corticicoccus populi TaxID=1812821 RepID=A0ABW5WRT9_9STAP
MIYTVTFNPSVDYIVRLSELEEGELNRSNQTEKFPGGKGINVSRIVKEHGKETLALGFIGGFTGEFIKDELNLRSIQHDFVEVEGDTRINVKLKTSVETEINASGPVITEENIQSLINQIEKLNSDDHVVFAGSVPSGHDALYARLAEHLHQQNVPFSIDAEGEKLTSTLKYQPYLVKPNKFELEGIIGRSLESVEEVVEAAKYLIEQGAENVLVTLGKDGALFINKEHQFRVSNPGGVLVNSVGAGDSTVAGFISHEDKDIVEQIKYSIASGSATAFNEDLASIDDIEALFPNVEVEKI